MEKKRFLLFFVKLILGKKFPFVVWHSPTFKCNRNCKYCGISNKKTEEMSIQEIKEMMKFFSEKGTAIWNFTGGEPLLRKDFDEIALAAKNFGFYTTIVTNGYFVGDKINSIKNIDSVIVSLDGTERTNDKIRGKGSYKTAIQALDILEKNNINFSIDCVLSKWNSNDKDANHVIGIAKKYGVKINFIPAYEDQYNKSFFKENKDYQKVLHIIMRNLEVVKTTKRYFELLEKGNHGKCFAGRNFIYIFPDGKTAPCFFKENHSVKYKNFDYNDSFKSCNCTSLCYQTYNMFFSFDPKFIFQALRNMRSIF